MSKERLETIKELVRKIESILYDEWRQQELTNLIESLYYDDHVDWLIQQAEKVEYWMKQHRKRANELEDAYFNIQLIENQLHQAQAKAERYEKALELIYKDTFYESENDLVSPIHVIRKRAEKALKGETK